MSDARLSFDPLTAHAGGMPSRSVFDPPEVVYAASARVACDGSGDVPAALGHPRIWLQMDASGLVDCPYCDRRFILAGGPADRR